ncbi:hypothetical protein BSY239_682 [Hydrogenophaga sp. RAC07]|uniref:hypothetical protein n=1 Tax=Hydrogenophaga sp. RAC07 TaxID=1842537 RepID=UPI00083CC1A9|nr:hypothetical protein [Hydrogenophaga sp. RAC07]AOF86490.1 hypothetical protein BSY239_682 [Hydrogenophaga sp. RAC07]
MQLDPSIILGFKSPQIDSPHNALAKMLELEGMQQGNQMRRMQMQDAQETRTSKNKLAELYQSSLGHDGKIDRNKLFQGAAQRGMGAQIPGMQKEFAASDEQTGKVDAQAFKLANDRFSTFKQSLGALSQRPDLSKELVMQAGQELVAAGIIPVEMYQRSIAGMPDDPNALRMKLREGVSMQLTPEQQLTLFAAKPDKIDNGQQISFRDTNPNSPTYGQNTGGAPVQKMQSPESIASQATARRGQDLKFQTDSGANAIAGQAIVSKKVQDVELKLQDDYRTESKGFSETATAMKKIMGAIETADTNPGSALSAGTAFMKLLDPNSVVRETELGMALNASGWFDRATNIANTLQSGRVMTATQKRNLKSAAEGLFEEAKSAQREVDAAYRQRATDYGANPDRVIVDRGQRTSTKGAGGMPSMSDIEAELARRQGGR